VDDPPPKSIAAIAAARAWADRPWEETYVAARAAAAADEHRWQLRRAVEYLKSPRS
jgi:hypothetical protein